MGSRVCKVIEAQKNNGERAVDGGGRKNKAWKVVERHTMKGLLFKTKGSTLSWTQCCDLTKCVHFLSLLMITEVTFSIKNGNITRINDPQREILP